MNRLKIPLLMVLALAMLAGCGNGSESGEASGEESLRPATAQELAGRAFTSTSVTGRELVPQSSISLEFTEETLGFRAGCNSNLGKYRIRKGNLKFSPGPSTLMGCPEELMAQDDWLRAFLADGVRADLGDDRLVLSGSDDVTIELEETEPLASS